MQGTHECYGGARKLLHDERIRTKFSSQKTRGVCWQLQREAKNIVDADQLRKWQAYLKDFELKLQPGGWAKQEASQKKVGVWRPAQHCTRRLELRRMALGKIGWHESCSKEPDPERAPQQSFVTRWFYTTGT